MIVEEQVQPSFVRMVEPGTSRGPKYGSLPPKISREGRCVTCQPHVARRFLALFVACLAKLVAGSTSVFHMYANSVKKTFRYTQSEVAVLAAMHVVGVNLVLPAGLIFDRYGPMWTTLVGLVTSCIGYSLIYSAILMREFYVHNNALFAFYFFIANHGTLYMYMAAMVTCIQNFPEKHRAKVVALLDCMYGTGMMVFATIYSAFFVNGHFKDEQNQNLKGFVLFLLITVTVACFLCVLFLRVFPLEENETQDTAFLIPMSSRTGSKSGSRSLLIDDLDDGVSNGSGRIPNTKSTQTRRMQNIPQDPNSYIRSHFFRVFVSLDFQCLMWTFVLITSTTVMFINNLTAVTKSVRLGGYNWLLTMVFSSAGMLTRFIASPLSDLTFPRIPRAAFLIFGNSCSVVSFVVMSVLADNEYALFGAATGIGTSISLDYTFAMTALSEHFGTDHFGLHFGVFKFFDAIAGFSTNRVFGAIYDGQIQNRTSTTNLDCFGKHCSQGSMILGAIISGCAVVCAIGYILKTKAKHEH